MVRYGFWLDHKGKVQADSLVLRVGPAEFLVASYACGADRLRAHMEQFIIADDVVIADETAAWTGVGAFGGEAAGLAKGLGIEWPAEGRHVRAGSGFVFVGRRSAQPNLEMIVPADKVPAGWVADASAEDLERERIRSGIPAIPQDLTSRDMPNEGGLEDVGISYTKGCFTGQEVMARLKNLGQVRRRLMVVGGPGRPPSPGAELFQRGKRIGELRSAVRDGDSFLGFAMMSLIALDPAAGLSLAAEGQETVRFLSHG